MSEKYHVTGRQIAAARTLAGINQDELADRANISVPTLRRMEASAGGAAGLPNNVAAVRTALEAAGVEFTNGGQPGVRMKLHPSVEVLDQKIAEVRERMPTVDHAAQPSPEKGMRLLQRAKAKNELVKLKNRRKQIVPSERKD
jgi:transcriptional regulator with XRE-family HTH domain